MLLKGMMEAVTRSLLGRGEVWATAPSWELLWPGCCLSLPKLELSLVGGGGEEGTPVTSLRSRDKTPGQHSQLGRSPRS